MKVKKIVIIDKLYIIYVTDTVNDDVLEIF